MCSIQGWEGHTRAVSWSLDSSRFLLIVRTLLYHPNSSGPDLLLKFLFMHMLKVKVFHTLTFPTEFVFQMNFRIPWFIFCKVNMKSNDLSISKQISGCELFWESLPLALATRTCAATRASSFSPHQYRACLQANNLLSCDARTHAFAQKTF